MNRLLRWYYDIRTRNRPERRIFDAILTSMKVEPEKWIAGGPSGSAWNSWAKRGSDDAGIVIGWYGQLVNLEWRGAYIPLKGVMRRWAFNQWREHQAQMTIPQLLNF